MNKFRDSLYRFMNGRYGSDQLNRFLLIVYIAIFILNLFFRFLPLYYLGIIVIIISFFRMFSKNIWKRQRENEKYLYYKSSFDKRLRLIKNRFRDRKTHIYRKCPNCKTVIRLPKKKGHHTVCCPKCHRDFTV